MLARRAGLELPSRRESCFFNPQHGPGTVDIVWAPPGGVERTISICRSDANRLDEGFSPRVRQVRVGDANVPWYAAGGSLDTVSQRRSQALHEAPNYAELYVGMAAMNAVLNHRSPFG